MSIGHQSGSIRVPRITTRTYGFRPHGCALLSLRFQRKETVPPLNLRKTLLALLIGASPAPAMALPQTIALTDAGYKGDHQSYADDLEFSGSFTGLGQDAIVLANSQVMGNLTLGSAINDNTTIAVDMVHRSDGIRITDTDLSGFLTNRGNVITTSLDGAALRLSASTVDDDLTNEGLLKAGTSFSYNNGGPTYGIDLSSSGSSISRIHGNLVNAAGARIIAIGRNSRAINLAGANLEERVVNRDSTSGVAYGGRGSNSIRLANNGWLDVGDSSEPPTTFSLQSLHATLDGNLRVADNSALGMWLAASTDPSTAVLKVSGIAEFGQNARILLEPEDTDFQAGGSRYLLLEAGQVQVLDAGGLQVDPDGKPKVASTSAMLDVLTSTLDDNKVYAVVSTKPTEALDQIVAAQGGNGNAQQALGSLSQAGLLARLGNQDPLFLAAAGADEAQLARLAEQLAPEVSDGARQAAITSQRLIGNAIDGRTHSLRAHTANASPRTSGVWMQSLYSDASQQQRDGIAGYNAYSRGVAVGADGQVNDQLTLGAAYSFIDTDVNGRRGNKTQVQSHAFSLYGSYALDNYFVDASLTYGVNDNEGKREIAGSRAKSDYDSNLLGLNLIGGYGWQVNPRLLVEPRLAARYSRVDIDSYREKGSSAALKVKDQRYEAIELGAGIRLAGNLPLGAGSLEPQLKLMAYHDFAADPVQNSSSFVLGSTPFVTRGASVSRNSYEAGVGADYKLGAVSVGVSYDYVTKSGFDADVFSAQVRYAF
ncbi:hypothetical protein WR25_12175 [Diploscapter pachys]|uniref:Autotransporter domain-containing protein n=1 Tax=Diploscapter pachys TaxID=2018661 RepID=A0A2A2JZV5_9BILA|nr:hypothetical protein WR25_12175 [Diploscapter pachys]